ncbi:alpha/beta fold hydrolase [Bacillus manliponensis]|uniref:alpha/beta fold hydrolase n=1 Tax=Bacillus manliponensis TaxID=574376 RepID=UPI0035117520
MQPHHTPESMAAWIHFHKELATLSTNSKHIIIEDAGHAIHMDRSEVVVEAIRDMLKMTKK